MAAKQTEMLVGTQSRYRLERLVFRGSHAQIWMARSDANRLVAIKKRDPQSGYPLERWEAERKLLERLEDHGIPGVIRLLDQAPWGEEFALVFPWYPRNLSALAGVQWDRLRPVFVGLAETLREIHQVGIIHRDVSLENILLEAETMSPVLADFGLAVVQGTGMGIGETYPIGGNPDYALPIGQAPGTGGDWHGLAVCAWKLLVGDFPGDPTSLSRCRREALAAGLAPPMAHDLAVWVVENPSPKQLEHWLRGEGRLGRVDGGMSKPWLGRWGALALYICLILMIFLLLRFL